MKCNFCGAELPDGSKVCYECGARLTQTQAEDDVFKAVRILKSGVDTSSNGQPSFMTRAGSVADHAKILAIGYSIEAIVSIAALALVFFLFLVGNFDVDTKTLGYITNAFGLVSFVCIWIAMARLKEYDDGIAEAYKFFIAYVILSILDAFIPALSIATLICMLIYYSKFYSGLSSLCQAFPDLEEKWGRMFKIFIGCVIGGVILIIALLVYVASSGASGTNAIIMTMLTTIIMVVPSVLDMVYAWQTRKAFADYAVLHGSRQYSDF